MYNRYWLRIKIIIALWSYFYRYKLIKSNPRFLICWTFPFNPTIWIRIVDITRKKNKLNIFTQSITNKNSKIELVNSLNNRRILNVCAFRFMENYRMDSQIARLLCFLLFSSQLEFIIKVVKRRDSLLKSFAFSCLRNHLGRTRSGLERIAGQNLPMVKYALWEGLATSVWAKIGSET